MLDILRIIHNLSDPCTASRIRRTCRRMSILPIPKTVIVDNKYIKYTVGDLVHREDGPAITTQYDICWYRQGRLHRAYFYAIHINMPDSIVSYQWYEDGVPHREGQPAAVFKHGEEWAIRGKHHRKVGPAVYNKSMSRVNWCSYGLMHRLDDIAYKYLGTYYYCIYDKKHCISKPARIDAYQRGIWIINDIPIRA